MTYSLLLGPEFQKAYRKLDKYTQRMIRRWMEKNLSNTTNPRAHGKALVGNLKGLWRYRIGDYRLICSIEDNKLTVLALTVGHRRDIYTS